MRTYILFLMAAVLGMSVIFSSCSQKASDMRDGYYTAEASDFDSYGWKDYITIYVSGNKILTVEYDSYNESGLVKSWDINYMRAMTMNSETYPNEFTRTYAVSLLNWQDTSGVDAITGATTSHTAFQMLAEAAIAQAKSGDKRVAMVELPEIHAETEG